MQSPTHLLGILERPAAMEGYNGVCPVSETLPALSGAHRFFALAYLCVSLLGSCSCAVLAVEPSDY